MSQINFTANLVHTVSIKQKRLFPFYGNVDAYVVELDTNKSNDLSAFDNISLEWKRNGGKYASDMYCEVHNNLRGRLPSYINKQHCYALSAQKENLDKIIPQKILGLMIFSETYKPLNKIEYLQVSPFINKSNYLGRKFKNVGKQLVQFAQFQSKDKGLYLYSDKKAIGFYKKLGFVQLFEDYCRMDWRV